MKYTANSWLTALPIAQHTYAKNKDHPYKAIKAIAITSRVESPSDDEAYLTVSMCVFV